MTLSITFILVISQIHSWFHEIPDFTDLL